MDAFPPFAPPTDAAAARLSWVTAGLATVASQAPGSSATHGGRYQATSSQLCTGCRFWCASGVAYELALFDALGNLVTSRTVTTTFAGVHVVAWTSPVPCAAMAEFTVAGHDTATSGWQAFYYASAGVNAPPSNAPQPLGPYLMSIDAGVYVTGAGLLYPTGSLSGADIAAIEPLLGTDALVPTD